MSFIDLHIKQEYRSLTDNMAEDFYCPILRQSVLYKRAVGFFSSSALAKITTGISQLIVNNGKIELVSSPHLSQEDVEAINRGYEEREIIIKNAIFRELEDCFDFEIIDRLNLLAWLIAHGRLDIRIALVENNSIGIFHEKMGLMYDEGGNVIAYSGSMNESETAFSSNYEAIDVFTSWSSDYERVKSKEKAFESVWNNRENGIETFDFPEIEDEIVKKYLREDRPLNLDLDNCQINEEKDEYIILPPKTIGPVIPQDITYYDYQKEAISNWKKQDFCGIFDMATGTGKTLTGLGAIAVLSEECDYKLAVFIVCPFQHLVEQWVEDIKRFNIDPIIGYSSSRQRDWKKRLKGAVFNQKATKKKFFCFVTTNQTFASDYVQKQIYDIKEDILLVVDEAHNFGSHDLQLTMTDQFKYRLALSATLERHFDENGTKKLFQFFGEKCIEYSLDRAIKEGKLTPYYYKPVVVYLTPEELSLYQELSRMIILETKKDKKGEMFLTERGKQLAIKRARIVAGAVNKIGKLLEIIKPYQKDSHILIYCGTATMEDEYNVDEGEKRQIEIITRRLGEELKMRVSQFTSRETAIEREILKREFSEGEELQALIAIKCLDEGVNIPSIKTAFILASTTNPKEYIQRRGRVLRRAEGKDYAMIFDFITLPRPLEEAEYLDESQLRLEAGLVKGEMRRCNEFKRSSINEAETDELFEDIINTYQSVLDHEFMEEIYE